MYTAVVDCNNTMYCYLFPYYLKSSQTTIDCCRRRFHHDYYYYYNPWMYVCKPSLIFWPTLFMCFQALSFAETQLCGVYLTFLQVKRWNTNCKSPWNFRSWQIPLKCGHFFLCRERESQVTSFYHVLKARRRISKVGLEMFSRCFLLLMLWMCFGQDLVSRNTIFGET